MSYCTPAQLLQFIDDRLIGDLIYDNGVRATQTQILTDSNVILALSTASGQINSAALTAQRYTVAELNGLTGDDQNLLIMMTAWLAFGILCQRRGRPAENNPQVQVSYKETLELLNQLRRGDTLFNVAGNVAVGVANEMFMTNAQWQAVNTLRSATPKYFPTRRIQNTQP